MLRGVGFVSGTYTDTPGVTPLTGAPTTEQNGVHTNFVSPVFFPQRLATVNYFGALDGNGTDGRTRLITTPVQYRSDPGSTTTNTERKYSQLGLQLFYSGNTTTYRRQHARARRTAIDLRRHRHRGSRHQRHGQRSHHRRSRPRESRRPG